MQEELNSMEKRDNHGFILTENSMFRILGLSQHRIKFEDARFNGKWTTRTYFNRKFHVYYIWPISTGGI